MLNSKIGTQYVNDPTREYSHLYLLQSLTCHAQNVNQSFDLSFINSGGFVVAILSTQISKAISMITVMALLLYSVSTNPCTAHKNALILKHIVMAKPPVLKFPSTFRLVWRGCVCSLNSCQGVLI